MRQLPIFSLFLSVLSLSVFSVHSIYIFSSPGAIPTTVPAACRAVLSQNITCEPSLVKANDIAQGRALGKDLANQYCTSACYKSLTTFKTNVAARCGNTLYKFYANSSLTQSGNEIADPFAWAYEVACLQDSTGFCLQALYAGNKSACSECSLKYQARMLSSDYGKNRIDAEDFTSTLSSCKVPASSYTYTYSPLPTATNPTTTTTSPTATPRCEGGKHTVGSSDSCASIAKARGMAIDRLITNNNLDYNCTSLKVGSQLCLEKPCKLHTVVAGETCDDIYDGTKFGLNMLVSWNPTIHYNCDNFETFVGRSICISPPGSLQFDSTPLNTTTVEFSSLITGSWVTGPVEPTPTTSTTSWYIPTTTHVIPTATAIFNETKEDLMIERTKYCWITEEHLANGFSVDDLTAGCQTLYERFCEPSLDAPVPSSARIPAVCTPTPDLGFEDSGAAMVASALPTAARSGATLAAAKPKPITSASALESRPSPFMPSPALSGMSSSCKQFFLVKHDGESCLSIIRHWEIPAEKFLEWNPSVGKECTGLKIGYYVCIGV
ncbi:hypothetical protein BJ508DRAFT_244206 [Ascobolus immersus RN42]|uniref:LysM domain-containing protein n=1 Tax=Ascobolus immersus RN42 TaxID=1160509 RepID=A0A3N4HIX1_ASCIM|nr:hypothetical protein BJ508DRAFT_244206 [Ascobolus immersus RN42]